MAASTRSYGARCCPTRKMPGTHLPVSRPVTKSTSTATSTNRNPCGPLDEIVADIIALETESEGLLAEIISTNTLTATFTLTRMIPMEAARQTYPEYKNTAIPGFPQPSKTLATRAVETPLRLPQPLRDAKSQQATYRDTGVRFLRTTDITDEGLLAPMRAFIGVQPKQLQQYILNYFPHLATSCCHEAAQ